MSASGGEASPREIARTKGDADRVSEALYARPASGYPGPASQRAFRLDKEAQEIIKIIVMDRD